MRLVCNVVVAMWEGEKRSVLAFVSWVREFPLAALALGVTIAMYARTL